MEKLIDLFKRYSGCGENYSIEPLPSSGGLRKYFRFKYNDSCIIGVIGTSSTENKAFIYLARHFFEKGLPVPEVLCTDKEGMRYLQEDLGSTSLFDAVSHGRATGNYNEEEVELMKKAVMLLPAIQFKGAEKLDFSVCQPISTFDKQSVMFDLNYFKYCFLKLAGIDFDEIRLERDFETLCGELTKDYSNTFMYRDFQARNIMIKDGNPYFIDFQGGRKGPTAYDLCSFVWQAKAQYSNELRNELVNTYMNAASEYTIIDRTDFLRSLRKFTLFRTMQVLGAYGLRGLHEKKTHFIESIPYAADNLRELLTEPFDDYPYLQIILQKIIRKYQLPDTQATIYIGKTNVPKKQLQIRIYSFSYKKGIPYDESGNGGGYVFDCRGIPNPGRLQEYKSLTGNDKAVADYLEQFPETERFKTATAELAQMHIENYIKRGFTDLMFSFGCTGGQHRSVYFANSLAEYLRKSDNTFNIRIIHREQNIEKNI